MSSEFQFMPFLIYRYTLTINVKEDGVVNLFKPET